MYTCFRSADLVQIRVVHIYALSRGAVNTVLSRSGCSTWANHPVHPILTQSYHNRMSFCMKQSSPDVCVYSKCEIYFSRHDIDILSFYHSKFDVFHGSDHKSSTLKTMPATSPKVSYRYKDQLHERVDRYYRQVGWLLAVRPCYFSDF